MNSFANETTAAAFLSSDRTYWRQQALIKAQHVMRKTFAGTILEIGAGSGWCSALLSTIPAVERVYCTDYDPVAVEHLMPQVQKVLGAETRKITRALASFNNLPLQSEVDVIVSIGALHHSENLYATLCEAFKALHPGGWLFATESVVPDAETNRDIWARYKKEDPNAIKKYGRVALHEENSDHYYRPSEFLVAATSAKFDAFPFVFDLAGNRHVDDQTLAERKTATGYFPNILYPYFAKNPATPLFDSLFLVLQKPIDGGHDLGHVVSGPGQRWQDK